MIAFSSSSNKHGSCMSATAAASKPRNHTDSVAVLKICVCIPFSTNVVVRSSCARCKATCKLFKYQVFICVDDYNLFMHCTECLRTCNHDEESKMFILSLYHVSCLDGSLEHLIKPTQCLIKTLTDNLSKSRYFKLSLFTHDLLTQVINKYV